MKAIFFLLLLLPNIVTASQKLEKFISSTLPLGITNVELIDLKFDEKSQEIINKIYSSSSKNKEWFSHHLKTSRQNGKPLSYNKDLNLTPDEYNYINSGDFKLKEVSIGFLPLTVIKRNNTLYISIGNNTNKREFNLNLDSFQVSTPYGILNKLQNNPGMVRKGSYKGLTGFGWSLISGDPYAGNKNAKDILIFIGRSINKNIIIHYKVNVIEYGKVKTQYATSIKYKHPNN